MLRRTAGNQGDRIKNIKGIAPDAPNGAFKICGKGGTSIGAIDRSLPIDRQEEIYLNKEMLANLMIENDSIGYGLGLGINQHNNLFDVCLPTSLEVKPYFLLAGCLPGTSLGKIAKKADGNPKIVFSKEELERFLKNSTNEVSDNANIITKPMPKAPNPTPGAPDIAPEIKVIDWNGLEKPLLDVSGQVVTSNKLKYAYGVGVGLAVTKIVIDVDIDTEEPDCECDLSSTDATKNPYDVLRNNTLLGENVMTKDDWQNLCPSTMCGLPYPNRDANVAQINQLEYDEKTAFFQDLIFNGVSLPDGSNLIGDNLIHLVPNTVIAWKGLSDASFPAEIRVRVNELYDGDFVPRVALKEGSPVDGEIELTFNWNDEEITEMFLIIHDVAEGGLRFRFKYFKEKGTSGYANSTITHNVIPATPSTSGVSSFPVNELFNMQSSVTNSGNGYYMLANARKLFSGEYTLQFFESLSDPLMIWKSLDPEIHGVFTADHRRALAIRLAGITDEVSINWVNPSSITHTGNHWKKMTTNDLGRDIDINVDINPITNKFCPSNYQNKIREVWKAKWENGTYNLYDEFYNPISWSTVENMEPN